MESKAIIDLQTGISRITEACRKENQSFFFYYGAGVSSPTVPLAEKTCEHCLTFRDKGEREYENRLDDHYTEILKNSFDITDDFNTFIKSQTDALPSESSQLLARLLVGRMPAKLAMTGNFDTGVEQAVRNMGENIRVWQSCPEEEGLPGDISLVYLQGSREEYSLEGLRSQHPVTGADENTDDERETFLRDQLSQRGCLVLGFSGREDNVFMRALSLALKQDSLGGDIFWFLYREEEFHALPKWLREHPQVVFVGKDGNPRDLFPFPMESDSRVLQVPIGDFLPLADNRNLPAAQVLKELVRALSVPLPDLLSNPMLFLQTMQNRFLADYGMNDSSLIKGKVDGYSLQTKKSLPLDAVREKLLAYQYQQAAESLLAMDPKAMKDQLDDYLQLVLQTIKGFGTQKVASDLLQKAIVFVDKAKKGKMLTHKTALRTRLGLILEARGDSQGAQAQYQVVLDLLKSVKPGDQVLDGYYDLSMLHYSLCHMKAKRPEEALAGLKDGFRKKENQGWERLCKAYYLADAGQYKVAHGLLRSEILDVPSEYLSLLCLYSEGEFEGLAGHIRDLLHSLQQGAKTMHKKAVLYYLLADLESRDENGYQLKSWNKLINRYKGAFDEDVRRIRAKSMLRKAKALRETGGYVEAIKVYDQLETDYLKDWDSEMVLLRLRAVLEKATVKSELGWTEDARTDLESLIADYGSLSSSRARELVVQGKYALAALSMTADDGEKASELFRDIADNYDCEESAIIRTYMATALLELAKMYRRQNDYKPSLEYIDRLIGDFSSYTDNSVERILSLAYLFSSETYLENRHLQEATERSRLGITRLKDNQDSFIRKKLGTLYLVLISSLEYTLHYKAGVQAATELLELAGDNPDLNQASSKALAKRADLYHCMGQHEEALKDYDRYVVRYGNEAAKEMKEDLLQVFYKRGRIQRQLGQNVNAQHSLDQVVLSARELEDPTFDELLARSYLDKAHMHLQDEQYEQQIVVLNEMEGFFQHRTGDKAVIYLMQALYERAKNYVYRQQHAEALGDLRRVRTLSPDNESAWEVFGRAAKMETTVLRKMGEDTKICGLAEVSRLRLKDSLAEETRKNLMAIMRESQEAWVRLGNHEKVVEGARSIVELFDAETSLDYRKNLVRTRLERMEAAFRLRDRKQVEVDFDILRNEINPDSDILLKELLARATLLYADMMLETGEQKPAIDQYLRMQQIFGSSKGSLVDEYRSKAIFKLGKAYTGIGSRKRAMKAFQELADTFRNRKEEATLINVYKGLLELAALLAEKRFGLWGSRNAKKAHKIYNEMLERTIPVDGEEGEKLLAKAMHGKSKLWLQQKKNKDAEQLVHTLIKTFEDSEEPYIRSLVEKAQEDLDELKRKEK